MPPPPAATFHIMEFPKLADLEVFLATISPSANTIDSIAYEFSKGVVLIYH
jgi:hypothetical protein